MQRRAFISLAASAAAVLRPFSVYAERTSIATVGFLSSFPPDTRPKFTRAFERGLSESGFVNGQTVAIEYRWAEAGQYERLPTLAVDLIGRGVSVLFATPINAAIAAKNATSTIPIVFAIGSDPVQMRLAATLNHPGGNSTGVTFLSVELGRKRLELLRELKPKTA